MTSSTTLPLAEQVRARIVELRKQAEQCEPDSGKWFRLHKTANELEQVLFMIEEKAKELEALPPFFDDSEGQYCPSGIERVDALALLIKKDASTLP